jgi:CubicO group peptidase (beta-lactamase class C family)
VIRRVDGRGFKQFVHEELCRPLGINDLHFGLPVELESRVAHLEDSPPPASVEVPQNSLLPLVFPPNLPPTAALLDQPAVHRATIPSSAGIMNARSLARMYAALANGGELDGVRILSSDRIALATAMQTDAVDGVISLPVRKALGYFLGDAQSPMGDDVRVFGHAGSGGSIGFADPRHRFAFALTKTRLVTSAPGEDAASRVASAVRSAVGIEPRRIG